MKTCAVCGRTVITGKKYCFRHRHAVEYVNPSNLVAEARVAYRKRITSRLRLLMIALLLIGLSSCSLFIHYSEGSQDFANEPFLSKLFYASFLITFVLALLLLIMRRSRWAEFITKYGELRRTKHYEEFVKSFIRKNESTKQYHTELVDAARKQDKDNGL